MPGMKFLIFAVLLFSGCHSKTQPQPTAGTNGLEKTFDQLFNRLHQDDQFSGNVLIASGDTVIYKASFGLADHATGRLLNDSSVFELASVSKQFTAMGIVLLKAKGLLSYDDSLRKFFPELPYVNITIQHLLHHTSGLPDYMELVMNETKPGAIATNADMIRLLAAKKPDVLFKPGEKWEYSNTGYALLASIIEKVSGTHFGDYLKQHIFMPLGMNHTQVYRRRYEKREVENYALGYVKNKTTGKFILPDEESSLKEMVIELDGICGDGTVNSTSIDLLKWSRALDKYTLVPKPVQDQIFAPGKLNSGELHNYAFGWMFRKGRIAGPAVSHSGGWPGYNTYIDKHLVNGKTIILLSNHDVHTVPLDTLVLLLYGVKMEPRKEIKVEETALKQYTGQYQISPDFIITITVENGRIYEQATGQGKLEIFPQKEDFFFLKAVDAQLQFRRNDKKEITAVVLLQNGLEQEGKKIK